MTSGSVGIVVAGLSVAMFVGTLAAIPLMVRRLPSDYFVRPPPRHSLPSKIVRNVLGLIVIAAGIAMIVLPGQGVLTILLGLTIVDLPAKDRFLRRILLQPRVQLAVQTLRAKVGRPPFAFPSPIADSAAAPARPWSPTSSAARPLPSRG